MNQAGSKVLRCSEPYVPIGVDEAVDTTRVELTTAPAAVGVTLAGENEQVAPEGIPPQLNATGALNPICGLTFTVMDADCPAATDKLETEVVSEKFFGCCARGCERNRSNSPSRH